MMAYEFYEKLRTLSKITEQRNVGLSVSINDAIECGMTSTEVLMRARYEIVKRIDEINGVHAVSLAREIIDRIDEFLKN